MSNWIYIRSTGFSAYLLLSLSVFIGSLYSLRDQIKPISTIPDLRITHIYISMMALGASLFHAALLLFARQQERLSLSEILYAFSARYDTNWLAFGTIAVYLLLILAVTGLLQRHFPLRVWRAIHVLSYLAYVLALMHSIAVGTDTGNVWVTALYASTGLLVSLIFIYRAIMAGKPKKSKTNPGAG